MSEWNHQPPVPVQISPLFRWPLKPMEIFRWFWDSWFLVSERLILVGVAFLSWYYLQPNLEASQDFAFDWILQMWARNFVLMCVVAGGLHLWFFTLKCQGHTLKYDPRDMASGRMFTFGSQTLDNMFWTLASGVTIWTAYEALMIWAFANGYLSVLNFSDRPVWFIAFFPDPNLGEFLFLLDPPPIALAPSV